jgi:hypothetical protein
VTLTQGSAQHPDPLNATYNPPAGLVSQFNDVTSPTYIDPNLPNVLLNLNASQPGMESWALAVGVRPQDVFGTSVSIFLIIVAAILLISLVIFGIDKLTDVVSVAASSRGPHRGKLVKTSLESNGDGSEMFEGGESVFSPTIQHDDVAESHRVINRWWNNEGLHETVTNMGRGSHLRLLQGNLTRAFLVFHFPIVTFCVYQLTIGEMATTGSMVLAGIAFAVLGLIVPAALMWRIYVTSTEDLQSDVSTLLALSPLYDTFGSRSYSFMAFRLAGNIILGIVIGAGQRSGTAQAVIILAYEIVDCLITVSTRCVRFQEVGADILSTAELAVTVGRGRCDGPARLCHLGDTDTWLGPPRRPQSRRRHWLRGLWLDRLRHPDDPGHLLCYLLPHRLGQGHRVWDSLLWQCSL